MCRHRNSGLLFRHALLLEQYCDILYGLRGFEPLSESRTHTDVKKKKKSIVQRIFKSTWENVKIESTFKLWNLPMALCRYSPS